MATQKQLRVLNRTRSTVLVSQGQVADTYWTRFKGLIGQRELAAGDGLLLRGEKAIHSFVMFIPIDVAYLDARGRVVRLDAAMPPNRIGPFVRGVQDVLELPAGTFARTDTRVGDELVIEIT